MANLAQQIKALSPGQSFTTTASRNGIYVAAKRAGITVSTSESNGQIVVTRAGEKPKELTLLDRVKRLNVTDRLALFEHFELCCGMDRGQCICPEEIIEAPQVSPEDERQAKLAMLRGQTAAIENSEPKAVEQNDDNWIEDGKTFENGEILYWHHKARCKPVIYRRETDWTSFA